MHSGLMVTNLIKAPHLWPNIWICMGNFIVFALWYSQSQWEQELSWRCVCSVCSFTREPKSSEARVSPTISVLFTCEHFPIEFHLLLYTCMDDGVDSWFRMTVLTRWLHTFLTHYHGSNKSSPLGTNNWMCISNTMCLTTRNHGFNFPLHTVV